MGKAVASRATAWGDWGGGLGAQPLARCVHHTIAIIIRTIEEDSIGADDMALTPKEVVNWARVNLKGWRL